MDGDLTLKEKVDKLIDYFEKEEKEKEFKVPFMYRIFKGHFTKKEYVLVFFIRTNGSMMIKKVKPEDNTIKIGDTYYDASADFVLRYRRYPVLIITEWNMKPFSPAENFRTAVEEGTLTSTEKVVIAKIEKDAIKPKFNFNMGTILIVIAVIVGGLIALNYFGILKL